MTLGTATVRPSASESRRRRPSPAALAWAAVAGAAAMALAVPVLILAHGDTETLVPTGVVIGLAYPAVGALIARRHPGNAVGWLFIVIGFTQALVAFAFEYATYALEFRPGALPFGVAMAWLSDWMWFPGYGLILTFLLLLFPDGRLPSRRWRPVAGLAALSFSLMVLAALATLPAQVGRTSMATSEGYATAEVLGAGAFFLLLAVAPLCALSLVFRWRASDALGRRQLEAFVLAAIIAVVVLMSSSRLIEGAAREVAISVGALVLPVATAVAVLRHRLYDLDLVVNRTLVYGALTALVVGGYVAIVTTIDALFVRAGSGGSLVAAGVVALAFQPVRERVQRRVNRLMFGQRDDPYGVLSALGRRLESAGDPDQLLSAVADSVTQALRLPGAAVELVDGGEPRTVAAVGVLGTEPERFNLLHRDQVLGSLLVARRQRGEQLSPADRRILEDVARQTAVAAHAVALTVDLRRSRERLRNALEEERRRIRRDLHDGLGPSLATVVVGLEQARNTSRTDPDAAQDLLRDLKAQTQQAIADIRALVYDLRPPALDELGLISAIREHAGRCSNDASGARLTVTVESPEDLPTLSAAVEVAAYRVVQEALTNVLRHARATSCSIRLQVDVGALLVEVADDGGGVPAGSRAGVGLTAMGERAEELGGELLVRSGPSGGTTVRLRLPLQLP